MGIRFEQRAPMCAGAAVGRWLMVPALAREVDSSAWHLAQLPAQPGEMGEDGGCARYYQPLQPGGVHSSAWWIISKLEC